jgi:hypothetical protein
MTRIGSITMIIVITFSAQLSFAQSLEKQKAAITATQEWLALIDAGHYAQSWQESATYFRNAVAKKQWEQLMKASRQPLGSLISRQVKSATYETSLPGAPDGEYVVIQFKTSYENKKSSVETVTPMYEKNRGWRVSGYFIK